MGGVTLMTNRSRTGASPAPRGRRSFSLAPAGSARVSHPSAGEVQPAAWWRTRWRCWGMEKRCRHQQPSAVCGRDWRGTQGKCKKDLR